MDNCSEYYYLNIIVNISSFSSLNTNVNTSLKYYRKQSLNKKLKLMEGTMKLFTKSYWTIKYLALWSPALRHFFWKICKTNRSPSYILYVHSLMTLLKLSNISFIYLFRNMWTTYSIYTCKTNLYQIITRSLNVFLTMKM